MSDNDGDDRERKAWPRPEPFDEIRRLYVGPIDAAQGSIETDEYPEPSDVIMWGEVLFYQEPIRRVRRVALYGVLAQTDQDARIGVFSLVGPLNTWQSTGDAEDSIGLSLRLHYRALNPLRRPSPDQEKPPPSPLEQMDGILTLEQVGQPTEQTLDFRVRLKAELTVAVLGVVRSVTLDLDQVSFHLAGSMPSREPPRNPLSNHCSTPASACDPGLTTILRTLPIKFVSFSEDYTLAELETRCNEQILGVCEVWRVKAALDVLVWPNYLTTSPLLDGQIDVASAAERGTYSEPTMAQEGQLPGTGYSSANHLEIYLVDALPANYGGGTSHARGEAEAYCILDVNEMPSNQYLLAHELGHALILEHPGDPCPGSQESIMQSTGLGSPNPNKNTLFNCRIFLTPGCTPGAFVTGPSDCDPSPDPNVHCVGIHNPLVSSSGPSDCFRPDPVENYVRDFPGDIGDEPSIPPPGENHWSKASVWNRLAPTPGLLDPAAGPEHQEPSCANPNYMYVDLEYLTPLRDLVCVDFFLADPGVSLGHEHLVPLRPAGPTGVPNNRLHFAPPPAPGSLATAFLQWSWALDVPAGYPTTCCVFALVHSMDEPLPFDPLTVTFRDVFPLLGLRKNIAQRNLHIQGCTPPAGASLQTLVPWVQMANPFEQAGPARVEVDTGQAGVLQALSLEVDGKAGPDVEIGGMASVTLAQSLSPEDRRILRLRATLPPSLPLGTTFSIDLRFSVSDELVTGYRHVLRVAPLAETVAQVLDALFGALRDLQAGYDVVTTHLVEQLGQLIPAAAIDPEGALADLCSRAASFAGLANDLEAVPQPREEGQTLHQHLTQLVDLLSASAGGGSRGLLASNVSPNVLAEQIRELADRIQEPAGRLARQHA